MSCRRLLLLSCLLLALPGSETDPGEFSIRPTIPLDATALGRLRRLAAEDAEAGALVRQVAAEAAAAEAVAPAPLAEIRYAGLVNTDPGRIADVASLRSMDAVAALVQGWQATGEERFAAALRRHLAAWSATYRPTGNDVNENKLTPLLVAWQALRSASAADPEGRITAWVEDLGGRHARAVGESKQLTNRYTKHVRLAVYAGLAAGRAEWVRLGRTGLERFVAGSLRADGTSLDLERRDTLTYHCSALVPALELALLLGDEGRALYAWTAPGAGSLKASVDYVVPYATGERTREEWRNSKVELDRQRAAAGIGHYQAGRLFEPREACNLMEAASAFDPALAPIWAKLAGSPVQRFGSWRQLVHAALAPGR